MKVVSIHPTLIQKKESLPLFSTTVSAGFPSPADDYIDKKIDLNEALIKHPAATFFVRVQGDSMVDAGILNDDLLVVDRSLTVKKAQIIVAVVDGEFTVKRIKRINKKLFLCPENKKYKPLEIVEGMEFQVWGVVTYAIHTF